MRSILFLILFIAEGWFISISAQDSEQRILEQLDKAISQKEKFKNDREAVISQIKQRLNYATDVSFRKIPSPDTLTSDKAKFSPYNKIWSSGFFIPAHQKEGATFFISIA